MLPNLPVVNREIWFHHEFHFFFFAFFTGSISTMNWWSSSAGAACSSRPSWRAHNSLQAFTVRKSPIVNLDTPAGNDVYVFKFVIYYSTQIKFSLRDV